MEPQDITRIGDLYRAGEHTPYHPSYRAFVRDTLTQWSTLLDAGWTFSRSDSEPYIDSASMFTDIDRKHLTVFSGGSQFAFAHPLSKPFITRTDSEPWTVNEIFREVHDVLGHGTSRCPFETFSGELEAYRNHAHMYSPEAIPALYGETVGQLCHYFAGYGFVAVQRAVILPVEVLP